MSKKKRALIIAIAVLCAAALITGLCFFISWLNQRRKQAELARQVLEYTENKLAIYVAENEKYADYEVDVAFLGDSLTDGYPIEQFYPQFVVSNRGIGGDTTFTLQARLQTSVLDLKPKVTIWTLCLKITRKFCVHSSSSCPRPRSSFCRLLLWAAIGQKKTSLPH